MAECPKEITRLVEQFSRNIESYRATHYKEAQLRKEFLDPFFEALGWDMANRSGKAEAYKDVIHEASLKEGGGTKAPDYCFRIGGTPKFYLEAKRPSIDIKGSPDPAYQLRRYAWTAKLPLSILTDFEEFAVYDCRIRPRKNDKPAIARILYLTWRDYAERWSEIADAFSKEAIEQGSFDKYVESTKRKRGTSEVDREFLAEIERWRLSLARNIALRNRRLTVDELNFAVQRTIDRTLFLRMCEDRGIERYGQLRGLLDSKYIYDGLTTLYARADEKYNSGLFYFSHEKGRGEPDMLTPSLNIDDAILREIIGSLYYPDCPYEFSVLPAEILGNVYEQFLGKVIRLTKGHQAKVEDKPEVKKAGGVYYTPKYIVDYIVKNTVGKLCEGKTPRQISKLRILDPACGSGSFLIGAYTYLLDYHQDYYVESEVRSQKSEVKGKGGKGKGKGRSPKSKVQNLIYQDKSGRWKLTTAEKKRILLNNIYGVDIDSQAVEVTKLSLLLKVLEGESGETLERQSRMFHERALPDLSGNIKCGNSLIGPDYFDGRLITDDEEMRRINAFDWGAEFPEVFIGTAKDAKSAKKGKMRGGFDCVIGNPPYLGGREWKEEGGRRYEYFSEKYEVTEYQFDIFTLFWEQGIRLLKDGGLIGLITPNRWLNNKGCVKLRKFILENTRVCSIADYSHIKVFPKAIVLPIVSIFMRSTKATGNVEIFATHEASSVPRLIHGIPQKLWYVDGDYIFNIDLKEQDVAVRSKIESNAVTLSSLGEVKFGIKIYETGKGNPPQKASDAKNRIYESDHQIDASYRKYLEGKDVNRYQINWQKRWLKYGDNLAASRKACLFEGPRLLIRRIVGDRLIGCYVEDNYVTSQLLQIIKPHNSNNAKYLLGLLSSKLMAYYFRKKYNRQGKTFPEIRIYELSSLPIYMVNVNRKADKARHDRMVKLVERMLDLHKKLAKAKTVHQQTVVQRQIDDTDRQIDALVYDLYGLTKKEIAIVESKDR